MTLPKLESDLDLDLIDLTLCWLKKQRNDLTDQKDKCDICDLNEHITFTSQNHLESQETSDEPIAVCLFCKRQFKSEEE